MASSRMPSCSESLSALRFDRLNLRLKLLDLGLFGFLVILALRFSRQLFLQVNELFFKCSNVRI
jgi:hypothetical protein